MKLVKQVIASIKDRLYLQSLHPVNRNRIEQARETLATSSGEFEVLKKPLNVDEIKTPSEALATIFDLSLHSHTMDKDGEGILSPLGVAMHINDATSPSEQEYVH